MIKIGKIVNVVGLKGELKVYHYSDYKERFEELSKVYMEDIGFDIRGVRYMKNMVILSLEGINSRTEAEKYKEKELYIQESDIRELAEDTYYIRDLIGMHVIDDKGRKIGSVSDVIQNSAQDLYEVEKESGNKFLIPAVEEFILEIDLKNRAMKVKLIEGLLNL